MSENTQINLCLQIQIFQLGECANFEFYEGNDGHDIGMSIFHQGTDGACFEYIYIDTKSTNGTSGYVCEFDGSTFIDDDDYIHSEHIPRFLNSQMDKTFTFCFNFILQQISVKSVKYNR